MSKVIQNLREEIINPFIVMQNSFTTQQLDQIVEIGLNSQAHEGQLSDGDTNNNIRTCTLSWLMPTPENQWIFNSISNWLIDANASTYNFVIDQIEPFQFTNYKEDRAEFYAPHVDLVYGERSAMTSRKLSLVLQLTDPASYEGGDLLIYVGRDKPVAVPRKRGAVVVFPSFMMHEVTPVRRGRRNSLVTWAHGPLFR